MEYHNADVEILRKQYFYCLIQLSADDTYFPLSAVMYSSQDIVLAEGGVKDCLLVDLNAEKKKERKVTSEMALMLDQTKKEEKKSITCLCP